MQLEFPRAFFVSGTDTGVGKTVLSAMLALGLDAHYWKPLQSGGKVAGANLKNADLLNEVAEELCDSSFLQIVGVPQERILPARHRLSRPLSPHLSARLDGLEISVSDFVLPDSQAMKHLIVEGAGGLLVPINDRDLIIDLIAHFNLPVLLAARSGLGTINHTLMSLAVLRAKRINTLGVVMIGEKNDENRKAIEHFGKVRVLAQIPHLNRINSSTLKDCFDRHFCGGESTYEKRHADDLAPIHSNAHRRPGT